MNRKELIKQIFALGCEFVRYGGNHDWYKNLDTGKSQPIPRHSEIHDNLAKRIINKVVIISKFLNRETIMDKKCLCKRIKGHHLPIIAITANAIKWRHKKNVHRQKWIII